MDEGLGFRMNNAPVKPRGALSRERLKSVAIVGITGAGLALLFLIDPAGSTLYPFCLFHKATGLYCPGCGTLRALHQLSHLHIAAAFWLNPLAIISTPFLGYALLSHAMRGIRGRALPDVFVPPSLIWLLLAVILVFWALRNIQVYPFSLLAP